MKGGLSLVTAVLVMQSIGRTSHTMVVGASKG